MKNTDSLRARLPMRVAVKLLLVGLTATIGVSGIAGMAVAHTVTISSQHSLSFSTDVAGDVFMGRVSSTKAFCERGRSIVLYRVVGDSSVPDEKVATAKTNESSMWSQGVGHAQAGRYYAVATRKVIQLPGHRHICTAARSATLSASPALEGLWLDPHTVEVGQQSTGTVSLSVSTEDDRTVSLASSDASVASVPATVTVGAGQDQASFEITGVNAGSTEIQASLNGASVTQTLTVNNP